MDKIFERTLLYDFYGELLTDKQKSVYENYYLDDLSLAEISENVGISRQAVHDTIKKSDKQLEKFESKLNLVARYMNIKKMASDIDALAHGIKEEATEATVKTMADELSLLTKGLINSL